MTDVPIARKDARFTGGAWLVGVLITAWILWGPLLSFTPYGPRAHLVLDTVDACVALLAGYLVYGRFVRHRRVQDLLLGQALLVLAMSASVVVAISPGLPGEPGATEVWLPVAARTAGAVMLLAAALIHPRRTSPAGSRPWMVLGPSLVVLVLVAAATTVGEVLPVAVDTAYLDGRSGPQLLTAHPALIGAQLFAATCFLIASLLCSWRAALTGDVLLRWLGPACALGGFARVNYALAPSLYSDWLYTGDLLRTGFYLLLLVGSAKELAHYWTAQTEEAVLEDRRRVARELHDGVVQELAYIRGEAHAIHEDPELRGRIVAAADRALDEARTAIHTLGRVEEEPLKVMLERAARELGRRHRVTVEVTADGEVEVNPDHLHTLLRIVREAVGNAARHGCAQTVSIGLANHGPQRLLHVRDDGSGFDLQDAVRTSSGYGLVSMSERARSLPGTLEIHSAPGQGSEVRVRW